MKRAVLVSTGTAAGLAVVLLLNPSSEKTLLAAGATTSAPKTTGPDAGAGTGTGESGRAGSGNGNGTGNGTGNGSGTGGGGGATTDPGTGPGSGGSGAGSGTVAGDTVQTRWGPVQVQVTVAGGKLTDVQALQLPDGDQRSYWISQQVGPMLREQALQAQSAQIDGVSGATYTSMGYQQSLASALSRAGL